jgi:hypothetical protein
MTGFEAKVNRPQFGGAVNRPQFSGRRNAPAFSATAPSEITPSSETATVIDDFEDGDISEYRFDTEKFVVQTTVVKEGSSALEVATGTNEHIISYTGNGLPYYPEAGDTFRWWGRTSILQNWILLYFGVKSGTGGASDTPDGYATFLHFGKDKLILRKREGGTNNRLAETAFSFSTDTWYDTEIIWKTNGTISVRLLDDTGTELATVSATDTTFTSGGIAWQSANNSGSKYMDYVRKVA